mmetsp:Transcript_41802/g.126291  ORF Transcript_41802/g.126291 Transcript_41802/m.126291 type:complete len:87 (-) Transcript_41802:1797-2057(-)
MLCGLPRSFANAPLFLSESVSEHHGNLADMQTKMLELPLKNPQHAGNHISFRSVAFRNTSTFIFYGCSHCWEHKTRIYKCVSMCQR